MNSDYRFACLRGLCTNSAMYLGSSEGGIDSLTSVYPLKVAALYSLPAHAGFQANLLILLIFLFLYAGSGIAEIIDIGSIKVYELIPDNSDKILQRDSGPLGQLRMHDILQSSLLFVRAF